MEVDGVAGQIPFVTGSPRSACFCVDDQSGVPQPADMARKLRVEYAGAIYHVMNRGDRREPIFKDDLGRRCFLESLAAACA